MTDADFNMQEHARRALRERGRRGSDPAIREAARESHLDAMSTVRGRAKRLFDSTRRRASEKGMEFDLSVEWIAARIEAGTCESCGLPFDLNARGGRSPRSPSIDRINAAHGYVASNCRLIFFSLNAAFGNWGDGAFESIARAWLEKRSR